ncbi:YdaU family protein [Polynucleobacter sp.]|uniref:YdaU family protein n=1 Tax=Polynucleobacter sp. TaxID=2029855 RepID=UPI003F69F248
MHYYSHHIGDMIRDTAHLDDHQLATYMRMIWAYYQTEKPFENNMEDLAFAMRSDEKTIRLLLRHYFKLDCEVWRHGRCDKVIAEYHSKSEKAAQSAKTRWTKATAKQTDSESNADALTNDANAPKNDANHKPITNNHKPIVEKTTTRGARLSTHFEPDFDFAKQNGIANPAEEYEKFKDYWFSQAGAKGVKLDWQATWRNWCRSAKTFTKTPAFTPPSPAITTPSREAIDPIMAMAIQESARTFKPVTEIYKSMKNKALGVAA